MSMALAHFAFGAALTSLFVIVVPRVPFPRTIVLVGGGWAMMPDLHWVSPVARAQLYTFHNSPLADLFWLHRTLDVLDPTDSQTVAAGMLALLIGATVFGEWRSFRAPAIVRDAVDELSLEDSTGKAN